MTMLRNAKIYFVLFFMMGSFLFVSCAQLREPSFPEEPPAFEEMQENIPEQDTLAGQAAAFPGSPQKSLLSKGFAQPTTLSIIPQKVEVLTPESKVLFRAQVKEEVVYKKGYFLNTAGKWQPFDFLGKGKGNWLEKSAVKHFSFSSQQVRRDENSIAAYACSCKKKNNRNICVQWDCHENRWMVRKFTVGLKYCALDLQCPKGYVCEGTCLQLPQEPERLE